MRSSLIRNSPAVCACVCVSPYERLYEFLSAGTTHPVSPISLKAISLLFRLPPDVWLHNTSRRDADLHLSHRRRLVCPQTGYRLVLWFFLCCGQGGVSGGPLTALFSCSRGSDFLRRPTCLIHTEILEYPSTPTPPPHSCKFKQQSSVRLSYDGPSVREIKAAVEALLLASKTQTRRHFPVLLVLVWESRNRRIFFLPWRGRPSCDQLSSETQSFCSRCLYNTSCEAVNMCTEQL